MAWKFFKRTKKNRKSSPRRTYKALRSPISRSRDSLYLELRRLERNKALGKSLADSIEKFLEKKKSTRRRSRPRSKTRSRVRSKSRSKTRSRVRSKSRK